MTFLRRLLAWRLLPVFTGGALFALVMGWTFTATPLYRSEALLQVESSRPSSPLGDMASQLPGSELLGLGRSDVETQVALLRSRRVLDAVLDSLGLGVIVREPTGLASSVVHTRSLPEGADPRGLLTLSSAGDGTWQVAVDELEPAQTVASQIKVGDTLRIGRHEIVLASDLVARDISRIQLRLVPRHVVRREVVSRLDVRRQSSGADVIALTYDDADPARAAGVLSALLAEHRAYASGTARGDAGSTASELRRQLESQRQKLTSAEEAVRRYQESTGIVMPQEQGAAAIKRYATVQSALDAAELERASLTKLLALVESRASREPGTTAYRQLATFPSLITNRAIQDLLQSLLNTEDERSQLLLTRSTENAEVRRLSARIADLESNLLRIGRQYLESLGEQVSSARESLAEIDAQLERFPSRELQYLRLNRDRTLLYEGLIGLERQLRVTELQDALRLDEVRVVDEPVVPSPDDPYFPRVIVHVALGLVLALAAAGAVFALQLAARAVLPPAAPLSDA